MKQKKKDEATHMNTADKNLYTSCDPSVTLPYAASSRRDRSCRVAHLFRRRYGERSVKPIDSQGALASARTYDELKIGGGGRESA